VELVLSFLHLLEPGVRRLSGLSSLHELCADLFEFVDLRLDFLVALDRFASRLEPLVLLCLGDTIAEIATEVLDSGLFGGPVRSTHIFSGRIGFNLPEPGVSTGIGGSRSR